MAEIVWAAGAAHTGAMMREPTGGEDQQRAQRVFAGFGELGERLRASRPDVIVTVGTDHFHTFFYDKLPIFAIGTGRKFSGWGEFGVPQRHFRGLPELAEAVHASLVHDGFDVASARDMKVDHAFACPLQLLMRDWDAPILPVYVNCTIPPLPSFRRCCAFGEALGRALSQQTVVRRVAILATGGLSHWVGTPQTGRINTEFDLRFLDAFERGDLDEIASWDSGEIIRNAGNGAGEIRNWLVAAAAVAGKGARRIAYEPVSAWKTGIGLVELQQ